MDAGEKIHLVDVENRMKMPNLILGVIFYHWADSNHADR